MCMYMCICVCRCVWHMCMLNFVWKCCTQISISREVNQNESHKHALTRSMLMAQVQANQSSPPLTVACSDSCHCVRGLGPTIYTCKREAIEQ